MDNLKQFVIDWNKTQSDLFSSPDARMKRQQFRAKHPTEILALKCMDGRINMSVMTETPPGIIQPFRNMGGYFDLGWPFFGDAVHKFVDYAIHKGSDVLFFTSYHFSKGDTNRGCAGFCYDAEAARNSSDFLRQKIEVVFGKVNRVVYPILVGIETDEDALVLHGTNGEVLDIAEIPSSTSNDEMLIAINRLYPDMRFHMKRDLLRLLMGNLRHIKKIRTEQRLPIELDHREQIIAVGHGFDWLHLTNLALIIGPYDGWQNAVKTAGTIIIKNIKENLVHDDSGALLLISVLSRDEIGSSGWNMSIEKAKYINKVAQEVLQTEVPEIVPVLKNLVGVIDANTRMLHQIEGLS